MNRLSNCLSNQEEQETIHLLFNADSIGPKVSQHPWKPTESSLIPLSVHGKRFPGGPTSSSAFSSHHHFMSHLISSRKNVFGKHVTGTMPGQIFQVPKALYPQFTF